MKDKLADFADEHPFITIGIFVLLVLGLSFLATCFRLNFGEKTYTGYIYSAEDGLASTMGHLRFSQNAGEDTQPSFCVKKEHGDEIRKYAGSYTKVKVTVPAGFAIAWPWGCPIEAKVEPLGI